MNEDRALRAELERLQHHARSLRNELAAEHAAEYLARREALQQALARGAQFLAEREPAVRQAEVERDALAEQAAQARSTLAQSEQQELAPSLLLIPFLALGLGVPFVLQQATGFSAWLVGGAAALGLGVMLGVVFARPADEPSPLLPTLGENLFWNPAAWSLLAVGPAWVAAALSVSSKVRWSGDGFFPWGTLPLEGIALALSTVGLALAVRRLKTKAGVLALALCGGTTLVLVVSGHATLGGLVPPGVPPWATLAARLALSLPVLTGGFVMSVALARSRRVALAIALGAGLASVGASATLATRSDAVGAGTEGAAGKPAEGLFLEREQLAFRAATRELASYVIHRSGADSSARYYRNHPEEGVHPEDVIAQAQYFLDRARVKAGAAAARISVDIALLLSSLQLAVLALCAAWAPKGVRWWARVAAFVPMVLGLATVLVR